MAGQQVAAVDHWAQRCAAVVERDVLEGQDVRAAVADAHVRGVWCRVPCDASTGCRREARVETRLNRVQGAVSRAVRSCRDRGVPFLLGPAQSSAEDYRPRMEDAQDGELFLSYGTVIKSWPEKGTGVVRPDNGDREGWVHLLHIEDSQPRTVVEGDRVEVAYRHIEHGPSGRWHGERLRLAPG